MAASLWHVCCTVFIVTLLKSSFGAPLLLFVDGKLIFNQSVRFCTSLSLMLALIPVTPISVEICRGICLDLRTYVSYIAVAICCTVVM